MVSAVWPTRVKYAIKYDGRGGGGESLALDKVCIGIISY